MRIFWMPYHALPSSLDLELSRTGEVLTINGDAIDFSTLPEGATIEDGAALHPKLVGQIDRIGGKVQLTIRLPYRGSGHVEAPAPVYAEDGLIDVPVVAPEEGAV